LYKKQVSQRFIWTFKQKHVTVYIMNNFMSISPENVRVAPEFNGQIPLTVVPGTPESRLVEMAAIAGADYELDAGHLTKDREKAVRAAVGDLRTATTNREVRPVTFNGDAATIVLRGLGALVRDADRAQNELDAGSYNSAEREFRGLDVSTRKDWAVQAEAMQQKLADQGVDFSSDVQPSHP
jgi:hypothetical protein